MLVEHRNFAYSAPTKLNNLGPGAVARLRPCSSPCLGGTELESGYEKASQPPGGCLMPPKGNWLPFEEARAYVHSLGLISQDQWGSWSKSGNRPPNIPGNPDTAYKNHGWINFGDWLGTGRLGTINRTFRSFEEARDYVRSLGF